MNAGWTRREFLRRSAAAGAALAAALGGAPAGRLLAADGDDPPKMPLRPLGRTGVQVSILGFGGDGLISDSKDKDEIIAFVTAALDAGINYVDTAHIYGRCEENLGLVTGGPRRKDLFLATKTGARKYDTAMEQVETSLKRLRTDRLDLVQVHHLTDKDDVKALGGKTGVLAALRKLRDQKVVRFIGLTGHPDPANVLKALQAYDWDAFMCFTNPAKFSRSALREQLPAAKKKNLGIVGMKAFGGRGSHLFGKDKGVEPAALLRYALSQDVATVLAGMANRAELNENLRVARAFKPMTADEMAALEKQVNEKFEDWRR